MEQPTTHIKPGDIWRHYKNKDYRIIAVSCNTQDLTWSVVYEALYDNNISTIWHRPLEMFLEEIEIDGKNIPRFTRITENTETILKQANDAYAALRKDPKQWLEYQEELSLWESTLKDGLKD